jgi:UDP-GlcNAc:undecaprenyl-phosphate/decaprenyl-phosphate GlcNAc-1-phosphate transferase
VKQLVLLALPGLVAAVLAWVLTPLTIRLAGRLGAIDMPGPRRIHATPIPRLGGLAVIGAVAAVMTASALGLPGGPEWVRSGGAAGVGLGLLPVLAVSVRDDIRPVRVLPKLLAQIAGAVIAVSFGIMLPPIVHLFDYSIPLGWLVYPLSILWLVGVTNAFNLVDGLDGLSAGLGLISCVSLSMVVLVAGRPDHAAVAILLAGGILGFLPYNLHPARVFLGDTGATAIGFVLGCITLTSSALLSAGFATMLPVLLVGVPVADTLVSILRRTIGRLENGTGNGVHHADRRHIHHRLLDLGLSHRTSVLILYGVGAFLSGVALLSLLMTRQQTGLLLVGLLLAGLLGIQRLGYGEFAFVRRGVALRVFDLPMVRRAFFAVFVDIGLVGLALYVAAALKLDSWTLTGHRALLVEALTLLVPTQVLLFWMFGVYKGSWRLAGLHEFLWLCAAILSTAALGVLLSSAMDFTLVPPTLYGIYGFVALAATAASRASYRVLDQLRVRSEETGAPAILYGAGLGGSAAVREMLSNPAYGLTPVGFIDDDAARVGRHVNGYQVISGIDGLEAAIVKTGAQAVVVTSLKIPDDRVLQAQRICHAAGVRLLRMSIGFEGAMPAGQPGEERALA